MRGGGVKPMSRAPPSPRARCVRIAGKVPGALPAILGFLLAFSAASGGPTPPPLTVRANTRGAPPEWAVLQRKLISDMNAAARVYWRAFTYPGGTLRRGGKPDDDYESFANWSLFYALGGEEWVFERALEAWNGITRQWQARGRLRGEFVRHDDMLHLSEGYAGFQFFGLADPSIPENIDRSRRFAGFYLGEDPEAPNYDPNLRLLRSPLTGSAGPLFHHEAQYLLDYGHASLHPLIEKLEPGWYDDPVRRARIQKLFDEVVLRGDVPMNLAVTGLVTNAFLYTGEEKYRRWVLDYVDAWMERIRANGGVIPDNVGLSGKIGEYRRGQWWGGFFGWSGRYSIEMIFNALITAAECAYLLSGEPRYLELLRSQVDVLLDRATVTGEGDLLVPYKVGPEGWQDYRPLEPHILSHLWHASLDPADWARIERVRAGNKHGPHAYAYADSPEPPAPGAEQWRPDGTLADWTRVRDDFSHRNQNRYNEAPHLMYLAGRNPDWPLRILRAEYAQMLRALDRIRNGAFEHPWKSQTVTEQNPVFTNGLAQMTTGSPFPSFNGGLLRAHVRHFDPDRRRPGLPEDVAALVERVEASRVVLSLVNVNPLADRRVLIQAGAFGEHRFTGVRCGECDAPERPIDTRHLLVELPAGSQMRLELGLQRYTEQPSYAQPWTAP